MILCAYNFGQDPRFYQRFLRGFDMIARQPDLPRVIDKARQRGVGVCGRDEDSDGRAAQRHASL